MTKKRGQITIFVIIGVVVVVALLVYFLSGSRDVSSSDSGFREKAKILEDDIGDCFQEVYENSLMILGFQGGYYVVPDGLDNNFTTIPYYYRGGNTQYPSHEELESSLASLVDFQVKLLCFDYFQDVQVQSDDLGVSFRGLDLMDEDFSDYDVSYSDVQTSVKINDGFVIFKSEGDFTITEGEEALKVDLGDKSIQVESNLEKMYSVATAISEDYKENNEGIDVAYIGDLVVDTDLYVDSMSYINDDDLLIVISNNATSMPVAYQFLIKSSGVQEETSLSDYDF